jgi:hypothetical protein
MGFTRAAVNTRAKISLAFLCAAIVLALGVHCYLRGLGYNATVYVPPQLARPEPGFCCAITACTSLVLWLISFLMAVISSVRKDTLAVWVLFGCLIYLLTNFVAAMVFY